MTDTQSPDDAGIEHQIYRFGSCQLDVTLREIYVGDELADVQPKVFDLLLFLIENRHRMVDKDELLNQIWPNAIVTESSLTQAIRKVRAIAGDDGDRQEIVRTVRKRGYRFVAPLDAVTDTKAEDEQAVVEPQRLFQFRQDTRRKYLLFGVVLTLAVSVTIIAYLLRDDDGNVQTVQNTEPSAPVSPAIAPANSIAVLPFADMSESRNQEYFSDGISESILHLLTKIPDLQVAARTSSFSFKNNNVPVSEIGEALKVAYLLEGSVRKSGDQMRITAQLIETENGFHLWSKVYDRAMDDVFAIQDEIAAEIAKSLKVTLHGNAPKIRVTDPDAYALYLQALHIHREFTADSSKEALDLYQRVLTIDSEYAPAWTSISSIYSNQVRLGVLPADEGYALAREAAENALVIDPGDSRAFDQLGWIAFNHGNDVTRAVRFYEKALELDPGDVSVLGNAAILLQAIGHLDRAIEIMEYHVTRDAVSAIAHNNLAIAYDFAHRFSDSEKSIRAALRLSPNYWGGRYRLGKALLLQEKFDDALAAFESETTDEAYRLKGLALAFYASDRTADADTALEELTAKWGERWPEEVAQVHAYRGEIDAAFEWIDKADEETTGLYVDWQFDPLWRNLIDDPRWGALLERTGAADIPLADIDIDVPIPN